MSLNEILKVRRSELNLTQQAVAERLNVTRQTISSWENAKSYPDIPTLIEISELYSLSLDYMLKGDARYMEKIQQDQNELYILKKIRGSLGGLGVFLYQRFHQSLLWRTRWFIPLLYFFTFFLLFGGLYSFITVFVLNNFNYRLLLLILLFCLAYGCQAQVKLQEPK